jgi:hypothetical protein
MYANLPITNIGLLSNDHLTRRKRNEGSLIFVRETRVNGPDFHFVSRLEACWIIHINFSCRLDKSGRPHILDYIVSLHSYWFEARLPGLLQLVSEPIHPRIDFGELSLRNHAWRQGFSQVDKPMEWPDCYM